MNHKTAIGILLILIIPVMLCAWADWQSVANQHFRIFFKDGWEDEALKVLKTLEHYRPQMERMTGNTLGRIPFTIEDMGNMPNGYTDIYGERIALFAYPPTTDDLAVGEDWWQMVSCHEYLHMLQINMVSGTPAILRNLFGNIFYPNLFQPSWMTEGITVYGESKLSPYAGRMNGGTYPSMITTLAKKGKFPSPTKAAYYSYDTPQATYYTYGGAFYQYLTKTYGDDKLALLFDLTSSSTWSYSSFLLPNLHLDKSFTVVFGKPVSELWADWQAYEATKAFQLPEQALTSNGWFKSDLKHYRGKLYYVDGSAVKKGPSSSFFGYKLRSIDIADISSVKSKNPERNPFGDGVKAHIVIAQNSDFPAGYAFQQNNLLYTRLEWKRGFVNSEADGYGSVVELWQQSLQTGVKKKLFVGQLRAFLPMQDGSILISTDNKTHTRSILSRLEPVTGRTSVLYETEGLIFSMHEYGKNLILGYKPPWRNNGIYLYETSSKRLSPVINTPFFMSPVAVKGDSLLFNAVFDNTYNAYILNLRNNNCYRISNISDIRTPVLMDNGKLYFISLNDKGYEVYQDVQRITSYKWPGDEIPRPPLSTGSRITSYTRQGKQSAYLSNIGHLLLPRIARIPIINGTQDSLAIGAILAGKDAVGDFPLWMAQIIYDTYRDKILFGISLSNHFFRPLKQEISYSSDEENTLSSNQYVFLYNSRNYGLSNIYSGFSYFTKNDFERKVLTPYLGMNFRFSNTRFSIRQSIPLETEDLLASDRTRTGWQTSLQLHQQMPLTSEIKTSALFANDPDADNTEVFGSIRGYNEKFTSNRGALIQTSWYKPLFKIREGIWSPQIYLEDIHLGLFYDTAIPSDKNEGRTTYGYGVELLAEIGLAYNFMLNAGVRFSRNDLQEDRIEVILNTLF